MIAEAEADYKTFPLADLKRYLCDVTGDIEYTIKRTSGKEGTEVSIDLGSCISKCVVEIRMHYNNDGIRKEWSDWFVKEKGHMSEGITRPDWILEELN